MRDQHTVRVRLSLTFEELDKNGTVVRRSTDRFGVSHDLSTTSEVRARFPHMPATYAANKVGHSVADALNQALPPFLDGKTGEAFCPSTIHEGKEVPAPVGGLFINHWNPERNTRVWYCVECAEMGELTGLFERDKGNESGN
ncbi:hypothetical protein HYQ19_gp082 [Arthrobacter phage DrYang]|uniref:Uncharacterized protein n=1 Tax=Arthrobacter phage DrYang TaxID=2686080 RepID=A0A6B9J7L1_9CAUD|nr:hypothetical protein HYQ19_gp082 [Arthrobacter phage DrYang]QGZ17181.1 hypothetical protein SEA_DRYANG_82 [Arthrobacter phage DrYang]